MILKMGNLAWVGCLIVACCGMVGVTGVSAEPEKTKTAPAAIQSVTPLSGISDSQQKEISAATLSGDPLSLINQAGSILLAYNCYVDSETQAAAYGLPDKMVLRNMIRTALSYADEGPMTEAIFNKVYDIAEELAKNNAIGLGDDQFADEIKGRRESAKTRQWMPFPPPPPPPPMGFGFPPPPPPMWGPPMIVRPPWVRPPWARPPWARPMWPPRPGPVFW